MTELRKKLQSFWTHFNTLQKGIIFSISTVIVGLVGGFWWPLLCFHLGLPLASLGAGRLLSLNPRLDILKYVSELQTRLGNPIKKLVDYFHVGNNSTDDKSNEILNDPNRNITGSTPEVEVNQCLCYIKRDFLHSWYGYISDEDRFSEEAEELIDQLAMRLIHCIRSINVLENIPEYIFLIRQHLVDYQEATNKLNTQPKVRYKRDRSKEFKKIRSIEEAFAHLGKVHLAAKNDGELEFVYLRSLMDAITKFLLPENTFECYVARELLLEIVTCMVVVPVIEMFCDNDFLHKAMVLILSDEELNDMQFFLENQDKKEPSHDINAVSEKTDTSRAHKVPEVGMDREQGSNDQVENNCPSGIDVFVGCENMPRNDSISAEEILMYMENSDDREVQCPPLLSGHNSNDISVKNQAECDRKFISEGPTTTHTSEQTAFVNSADLAKHFRIYGHSSDQHSSKNVKENIKYHRGTQSEIKNTAPSQIGLDFPAGENLPDNYPSSSYEEGEEIPSDIAFRPSFFLQSDDELSLDSKTENASDECGASVEGSPLIGHEFDEAYVNNSDLVDGNVQQNDCEPKIKGPVNHESTQKAFQPLRKAVSCEILSNQNVQPKTIPISASTANLLSVGSRNGYENAYRSRRDKSNKNDKMSLPEPFVTGPVEGTSREMPSFLCQDVHITATEQTRDPARSIYTLYVIKYRAWHLEDDMWVLRKSVAKRRYREFVTLHERLEEHPIYKRKIKGVKGPNRWKSAISLGQLEIHGIEARRKFLEGYLQALIHRDQVGNSLAIREFLAYEEDAHIAFVKKAHEVNVPRIDKIIAKTVSGMINKITKTKSSGSFESRSRSFPKLKGARIPDEVDTVDLVDGDSYNLEFGFQHNDQTEIHTMENVLTQHIHEQDYLASVDLTNINESEPSVGSGSDDDADGKEDGDGEDEFKDPIEEQENIPPEECSPLAYAVLDIAVTLILDRNSWIAREKVINSLKIVAGKSLESFLREEISELLTEERWCHYIKLLSATVWPDGELKMEEDPALTEEQQSMRKEQARKCLSEFFPGFLPYVVGQDFDFAVDKVMEVIQHKSLNRHLIFTLLDKAVETLFPEVQTAKMQSELRELHLQKDMQS